MERRWVLVVVLAVLVAGGAGIAIGASLGGDDGDDSAAATGSTGTTEAVVGPVAPTTAGPGGSGAVAPPEPFATAGLDGDALELAEAYNRALQLTYHARYETQPGGDTEPVVVEVFRRPPLARRDTTTGSGDQALNISEYRTNENAHVGCVLSPDEGGQDLCVVAPSDSVDPADPIIGVLDPTTTAVTASDADVAGGPARCFEGPSANGTARVCFDGDGIPVSIDGGDGELVRVSVERGVDDDAFVLPATPTQGGPVATAPTGG